MQRTVLVIADSAHCLERCRQALSEIRDVSYAVIDVRSGSEALPLMESAPPDAMLIDWALPGNGGPAALSRIHSRYPYMPVILLAEDGEELSYDLEEMQSAGECRALRAGFTAAMLHGVIELAVRESEARKASARIAARSQTVLIIDDNPDDREFCVRALRQADERYGIIEAEGGMAGLDLIDQERPDCVLLDYGLPGMTGLEVLRRIHAIDAFLPVIMMTGQGHEDLAVRAIKGGAQNYLVKSALTSPDLHRAVVSAVEHAELERQITEQRQQIFEQKVALAETGRLTMAILDTAPCLICATDMTGRVLVFNKELERVLGYCAHEIVGRQTPALWSPRSPITARAKAFAEAKMNGGHALPPLPERSDPLELTFIRKDGSEVPVSLWVRELLGSEGKPVGMLGLGVDITERKRQLEALKTSEETFRSAMEHAPTGMALIELSGRFLTVNKMLCDILDCGEGGLTDRSLQGVTHHEDLSIDAEDRRRLLAGAIQAYTVEKRLVDRHGREVDAQLNLSLVRGTDGEPKYFVAQIQDIRQRKEIERLKTEFISVFSHELRTPLTSIRGSLGLLTSPAVQEQPDKAGNLVSIAQRNCERLILLINDILDIDRMEGGHMRFDIKQAPLAVMMRDAIDANRGYAQAHNVTLNCEIPADNIMVSVDPARFLQVLFNYISNAAKFSPAGGLVQVGTTMKESVIRISVSDHGPGIPEAFHGRLFQKFSQVDTSTTRTVGGSGLGLYITQQIAARMGGTVGFDTEVGRGSVFWIELAYELEAEAPVVLVAAQS
jgi:PAS domain S-box-containing protein